MDMNSFYRQLEKEYQLHPGLLSAIEGSEASGDAAVSPKGARGRFQFMPGTAKRFGLTDPDNPAESAVAAAKYARFLGDKFANEPALILAGYNAGEGAVEKHGGVPPYKETQNYVARGMGILKRLASSLNPIPAAEASQDTTEPLTIEVTKGSPVSLDKVGSPTSTASFTASGRLPADEYRKLRAAMSASQQPQQPAEELKPFASHRLSPDEYQALRGRIEGLRGSVNVPESQPSPVPTAQQAPGGLASFGQGVKSELLNAWQGIKQAGANAFSATMNPPALQGIPRSDVGAAVGTAAQQNADEANAEAIDFIARQRQEDQPYQQAHPWLFGSGQIGGQILATAPLMAATPGLPAVSLAGKGALQAAGSLATRGLADAALGAGYGAVGTVMRPQEVETPEEYRQNLANALAPNMAAGAIAGPVADVIASGAVTGARGLGNLLSRKPSQAMSQEALDAAEKYGLYYGAGDVTGSPLLVKQETGIATNLPFTGIPGKYEKGVEAAKKAAEAQVGATADVAGTKVAEELAQQQAARIAEQQGKVAAIRDQFAPPSGVSADQGIRAGAIEQLDANKGVIRAAYDKVGNLLRSKGLEEAVIPVSDVRQSVIELLDSMPKATLDVAPPSLVKRLRAVRDMTGDGGLTFNELRDLDKRIGSFYGQAQRAVGGVGDEFTRAYGNLKAAVVESMDSWANSSGNRDISAALSAAKKAHQELKLPYTKGVNPAINKVIGTEEAEGSYGKLFNPKTPEQSGTNFNLLSQSGQKSAKYGLFSDILRKSEKGGQFDRDAFLAAARENKALARKMLSPSEQQAFGDVVDSVAKNAGSPAIEKSATAALAQDDPSVLMTKLMQNDNKVRYAMGKLSPEGREAMGDYVLDKGLQNALDPVSGELSLAKYSSYLAKNSEVLKQAGKWDSVKGLVEVLRMTQRINKSNVMADPATGQRVITAAGLWYAIAHPFQAMAGATVGRVLGGLLTNKSSIALLNHIGSVSSKVAQSRMLSRDWQDKFSKVLQAELAANNAKPHEQTQQ